MFDAGLSNTVWQKLRTLALLCLPWYVSPIVIVDTVNVIFRCDPLLEVWS